MANKLILFLSKFKPRNINEDIYHSKYDNTKYEVKGKQTPDAPTKYFLNYLTEINETIDSILCITSKEAYNSGAYSNYEKMLDEYCDEQNIKKPKLIRINFDKDLDEDKEIKDYDIYKNLCQSIVKNLSHSDTIYIDYTSGIRDTSLIIILMIRYLEYTGIKCGGMIYSYFDTINEEGYVKQNKIMDLKSTYDLFELIDGVNEFTSFGKSKSLSKYYANIWEEIDYKEIKELIEVMDKFSDTMSLCIVEDIDQIIIDLNEKISVAKELKEKDLENDKNKLMIYMFLNLIEEIENKFYLKDKEKITYIKLIKWCLDNDLIQQALTLYVEKIPEYYNTLNIYNTEEFSLHDTLENRKIEYDDYTQIFYTGLFVNITHNKKEYIFEYKDEHEKFEYKNNEEYKINTVKEVIIRNKQSILNREKSFLTNYESYIKSIIERIYLIIDTVYTEEYNSKNEVIIKDIKISKREQGIPKTEDKFINWLNKQNKLISYLLEEAAEFTNSKNIKLLPLKNNRIYNGDSRDYIYNNKINSLIILEEGGKKPRWANEILELNDLIELMQDYLFFKIMRNQINHAKKSDLPESVREYFGAKEYKTDITIDNIKLRMQKSIEKIEDIKIKLNEKVEALVEMI